MSSCGLGVPGRLSFPCFVNFAGRSGKKATVTLGQEDAKLGQGNFYFGCKRVRERPESHPGSATLAGDALPRSGSSQKGKKALLGSRRGWDNRRQALTSPSVPAAFTPGER